MLNNIENEEKVMKGQIEVKEIEIDRIDSEITKLQENKERKYWLFHISLTCDAVEHRDIC